MNLIQVLESVAISDNASVIERQTALYGLKLIVSLVEGTSSVFIKVHMTDTVAAIVNCLSLSHVAHQNIIDNALQQ